MKVRRLLVCGVAASLMALTASAAEAAPTVPGHIQEVWTQVTGGPVPTRVSGFISCPAGMKVVSVGGGNAWLSSLTTTNDHNGGFISGYLTNTGAPFVPLQADCVPAADVADTIVRTATVVDHRKPSIAYSLFRATVRCPTGFYAFGGDGFFSNQNGVNDTGILEEDSPTEDGTGWRFAAWAQRFNTLNVRTQCAPNPPTGQMVSTVFHIPFRSSGTQGNVDCPAGHVPLSGGAYITGEENEGSGLRNTVAVRVPARNPSGWFADGFANNLVRDTADLHIVVRCL